MPEIRKTERLDALLSNVLQCCLDYRHEFVMPEHLLLVMIDEFNFNAALNIFYAPLQLARKVEDFLDTVERVPEARGVDPDDAVAR